MSMIRIGTGFDVHAFAHGGDHVMLGGVRIPHSCGVLAHSDGDVLLHATCDALLGALALGDIGHWFPPEDPSLKGADSRLLLRHVMSEIHARGWQLGNADTTVICERPKLKPHIETMRHVMAEDMRVDISRVSVKATTTEKLGFTGRKEGIAAQASVLLVRA